MLETRANVCHNVDLNVDIATAKNMESGETSTLQALEPRALIPTTQAHTK